MGCPVGAAVMRVEALRTGWPAGFPVDGRFRPGAPCESASAHRAAAGRTGTSNLFGLRPPRGRAEWRTEGGGSSDPPPIDTGRASWLAAHSSRSRWWPWPGAPPTGRGGGAHDALRRRTLDTATTSSDKNTFLKLSPLRCLADATMCCDRSYHSALAHGGLPSMLSGD